MICFPSQKGLKESLTICFPSQKGLKESLTIYFPSQKGLKESDVKELEQATERLAIESPAFNLRKRKSLSGSMVSLDSLNTSVGKKPRRLSVRRNIKLGLLSYEII